MSEGAVEKGGLIPGKIIHLDMDAFYAAVEQHDHPELRGKPVIVGGRERGVVAACSYEARPYGVRSAMSTARAVRLCPHAACLPVRMERYREVSREVFAIFARYTDRIEPLSIDEAFLDVSGCERLFGPARAIAVRIRSEVLRETGLTVSAGIAPNMFLAKLASEAGKPDGLMEIRPEEIDSFLLPMPVARLWGVGKVTTERLHRQGLRTVADLRIFGKERLRRLLGSAGEQLYHLAFGEDDRAVEVVEIAKSIGHEETYGRDLTETEELRRGLLDLAERVGRRLRQEGVVGQCLTLKVRYADFESVTRSQTVGEGMNHAMTIYREALALLARTEAGCRPVRLLGISLSHLVRDGAGQQDLFAVRERERCNSLDQALDQLHRRFGEDGVRRASLLPPGEKPGTGKKEGRD